MNLQDDWPLLVAGAAVVGGFVLLSQSGSSGADSYTYAPVSGTGGGAVANAAASASVAERAAYENDLFAAFGKLSDSLTTVQVNQMADAEAIALERIRAASFATQQQTQATIAQLTLAQQQKQFDAAEHQAQQTSLWNDIFATAKSIVPFFNPGATSTSNVVSVPGIGDNVASATYT